jgi:thiol-disulfide isomerase/thioredoxin
MRVTSRGIVKWLRSLAGYFLLVVIISFIANLWLTRNQAQGVAPEISGLQTDGRPLAIKYDQYKKPLIVYFFADWCPICKFQHPVINSIAEDYPVIGIAMQSGENRQLSQYLKQHEITLPVINDSDSSISQAFGVQGVPATFVINNIGEITFSTRGYLSKAGLLARLWWSQTGF